jgi:hypothetical protein
MLARPLSAARKNYAIQNVCFYNSSQKPVRLPAGKMLYHVSCLYQPIVLFSDTRSVPAHPASLFRLFWCLHVLLLLWCCTDACIHLASSKEILISVPWNPSLVPVPRRMRSKQRADTEDSVTPTHSQYSVDGRMYSNTYIERNLD